MMNTKWRGGDRKELERSKKEREKKWIIAVKEEKNRRLFLKHHLSFSFTWILLPSDTSESDDHREEKKERDVFFLSTDQQQQVFSHLWISNYYWSQQQPNNEKRDVRIDHNDHHHDDNHKQHHHPFLYRHQSSDDGAWLSNREMKRRRQDRLESILLSIIPIISPKKNTKPHGLKPTHDHHNDYDNDDHWGQSVFVISQKNEWMKSESVRVFYLSFLMMLMEGPDSYSK